MSTDRFRKLEPALPGLFNELAQMRTPDYLEAAIERASERSQRPRWTFPERWLTVELVTSRVPVARMPWRQIGALAVLAIVVIASLALYAGSQTRPLPAPFGPAANGSILFAMDGDIYTADPRTGVSKAIVTGPERDSEPVFSLDGTRVLFGRPSDSDPGRLLFVARDDGSGLVQVTPEPLRGLSSWSFSPDGRSITAFAAGDQRLAIVVIPSDGKSPPMVYSVFATTDDGPPQYSPDGSEIMFIGKDPAEPNRGVYGLNVATGVVRPIVPPPPSPFDIFGASWSPDGTHIAYGMHDTSSDSMTARTHVVAVDGTGDISVDTDPKSVADAGFAWSNDGTRLIISRYLGADGSKAVSAIVPIDRSSPGIEIECPPGALTDDCSANWSWSPDDSLLLGTLDSVETSQFLADPTTGIVREAPWNASGHPAWQRLAR